MRACITLGLLHFRYQQAFLVHCLGGTDRTGLFFVLLALREGKNWDEAMRQLSLWRFTYCSKVKSARITFPLYDFTDYAEAQGLEKNLAEFENTSGVTHRAPWQQGALKIAKLFF